MNITFREMYKYWKSKLKRKRQLFTFIEREMKNYVPSTGKKEIGQWFRRYLERLLHVICTNVIFCLWFFPLFSLQSRFLFSASEKKIMKKPACFLLLCLYNVLEYFASLVSESAKWKAEITVAKRAQYVTSPVIN